VGGTSVPHTVPTSISLAHSLLTRYHSTIRFKPSFKRHLRLPIQKLLGFGDVSPRGAGTSAGWGGRYSITALCPRSSSIKSIASRSLTGWSLPMLMT